MNFLRNLVAGGALFLCSHLIDKSMKNVHQVFCLDNFLNGNKQNI